MTYKGLTQHKVMTHNLLASRSRSFFFKEPCGKKK